MCPPEHFEVVYSINPWMDPSEPVDRARARRQWNELVELYRSLGHSVDEIEPVAGLPDMVFAANAGLVIDGMVLIARFRHAQRQPEEAAYRAWFKEHGFSRVEDADTVNEGEGDFIPVGSTLLS